MAAQTFVVGICGGTGSGKTTLAKALVKAAGDACVLISYDSYYRAHHELSLHERTLLDYDCPEAFEPELLATHLSELKEGRSVRVPIYDFSIYDRTDAFEVVNPAPIVVVEGIMVLAEPCLREQLDVKVFVDVDADVRVMRRAARDVEERGRSIQSVVAQYLETVKPAHDAYVEPSKHHADIIVPGGGQNERACALITSYLREQAARVGA